MTCPGCQSAMQRYFAGDAELNRCPFCGGLWFERKVLEGLTRPRQLEVRSGGTLRRCGYCRTTMNSATWSDIEVETCGSCQGTYLDDGELALIAQREVPLRPGPVAAQEADLTFRCGGCTDQFPLRDGLVTSSGLSCANCYGQLSTHVSPGAAGDVPMSERLAMGAAEAILPGGGTLYLALRWLIGE